MKQPFLTHEWMDGSLLYYIASLHISAKKKKKSILLSCRWDEWGGNRLLTAIWLQSISLWKVFPLFVFVITCDRKKWLQWWFCDWFQFPVWKLACFGVDSLMICACVSLWLISVVLLDTTSVLGELGWKAYPINGVRRLTFDFSFSLHFVHCNFFFFHPWAQSCTPCNREICCNLEIDNR